MLVDYDDDEEEEEDEDVGESRVTPVALLGSAGNSSEEEASSDEDDAEFVGPPPGDASTSRVLPVALTAAADEDDDADEEEEEEEDDGAPGAGPAPMALPAPDFTGWQPEGGGAPARQTAPLVSSLNKKKRGASGPSHISSGPRPSVTRHDALAAAAQAELDAELEERGRNNGLSSAYDSVFRGSRDPDEERRTKVNRKGAVRSMSKKEMAEEDAFLASLR